ncbi:MAG TPA: copper chaperone PCu(A)C [Gemmatimonadaceae bacterium]|nr:copper chaperone PCu(A)C [Gemmatimonadaceae bacterium]
MWTSSRVALALAATVIIACSDGSTPRDGGDPRAATGRGAVVNTFRTGGLVVENVVAPAPIPAGEGGAPIAVYFFIRNEGPVADTLDTIEITGGTASLHQQAGTGTGMETMVPLAFAVLPPGETLRFVPGGRHVMVQGVAAPVTLGDTLPITMVFRVAGRAPVSARVVSYGDLESILSTGAAAHVAH